MKHRRRSCLLVLVAALTLGRAVAAEPAEKAAEEPPEIYECTDAGGNVTYQIDPCEETRPKPRIAVPRAPAPAQKQAQIPAQVRVPAPIVVPPPPVPRAVLNLDEEDAPDEPGGPADPRLGSPERTWRTLRDALAAGDRALAAACLTSSALTESGPGIETLPAEKLRDWGGSLPEIDLRGVAGPFRVAVAKRGGPRPDWIFFEKKRNGDWKIAAM